MTKTARVYGGSLYDLAAEEKAGWTDHGADDRDQTDFSRKSGISEIAGRTSDSWKTRDLR